MKKVTFGLHSEVRGRLSSLMTEDQKVIILLESGAGVASTEKVGLLPVISLEVKPVLPSLTVREITHLLTEHSCAGLHILWKCFHKIIILLARNFLT